MLKKLMLKATAAKNKINKDVLKIFIGFSIAVNSLVAPSYAQNSPFKTDEMFGDAAGGDFVSQMKWVIFTFLQVALILAMIALVVYCVWALLGALRGAAKSGEWNEFFMSLIMNIIAIIAAVVIAGLGWQWLDTLKPA